MYKRYVTLKNVLVVLALSGIIGVGIYFYRSSSLQNDHSYYIYAFNGSAKDVADVEQNFKDNFYWLTTRDHYDVRAMLQKRSSDFTDPSLNNNMSIYLMREKATDAFIGFVTFFRLSFYKGQLLFLSVNKEFRGKRYGQLLVQHALDKMKEMGMIKVTMFTRLDNSSARKLYERIGFKVSSYVDNVGLYYDIYL